MYDVTAEKDEDEVSKYEEERSGDEIDGSEEKEIDMRKTEKRKIR